MFCSNRLKYIGMASSVKFQGIQKLPRFLAPFFLPFFLFFFFFLLLYLLQKQPVLNLYYPWISGIIVINQKPLSPSCPHDYNCKKYIYIQTLTCMKNRKRYRALVYGIEKLRSKAIRKSLLKVGQIQCVAYRPPNRRYTLSQLKPIRVKIIHRKHSYLKHKKDF